MLLILARNLYSGLICPHILFETSVWPLENVYGPSPSTFAVHAIVAFTFPYVGNSTGHYMCLSMIYVGWPLQWCIWSLLESKLFRHSLFNRPTWSKSFLLKSLGVFLVRAIPYFYKPVLSRSEFDRDEYDFFFLTSQVFSGSQLTLKPLFSFRTCNKLDHISGHICAETGLIPCTTSKATRVHLQYKTGNTKPKQKETWHNFLRPHISNKWKLKEQVQIAEENYNLYFKRFKRCAEVSQNNQILISIYYAHRN